MKSLIEVKNISMHFTTTGCEHTPILADIDLEIAEGEFLAILGPSGSGKSTLLRIIAGLIPATQGTVHYIGHGFHGVNPGVAMVFQSFALFPWLTVLQNVLLGVEEKNISYLQKKEKALQVIAIIGLAGFENAYPKELSGGMRQRVGIGRALVSEPDVLLMDEPFSALDILTAENLRRDLLKLWLDKKIPTKSIILVTHSIEEAVYMADRAIILSTGPAKIIADIVIDIPRWRERKAYDFIAMVDQIYAVMTQKELRSTPLTMQVAPKIILLPCVSVGALTGFLELLEELSNKTDLYKLAASLGMDTDEFLPIIEFASLLGFATILEGDIEITEQGIQFVKGNVLQRKEYFKGQLLKKVPFISKMIHILTVKSNQQIHMAFFEELIARIFGYEVANVQMQLIISWGRYAELFGYDTVTERLYLQTISANEQ